MAASNTLFHNSADPTCMVWGEAVGYGPDANAVFQAWIASPEHLAVLLMTDANRAGLGTVTQPGIVWLTLDTCS
jgi:uncharacterized protein YkwD